MNGAAGAATRPSAEPPALSADDARRRSAILRKLEEHGGNIAQVARDMGKARMQVHRWLQRFGIDPGAFRK